MNNQIDIDMSAPQEVVMYWDTQDQTNEGWAYRLFWCDHEGYVIHEESGGISDRNALPQDAEPSRLWGAVWAQCKLDVSFGGWSRNSDGSLVWRP